MNEFECMFFSPFTSDKWKRWGFTGGPPQTCAAPCWRLTWVSVQDLAGVGEQLKHFKLAAVSGHHDVTVAFTHELDIEHFIAVAHKLKEGVKVFIGNSETIVTKSEKLLFQHVALWPDNSLTTIHHSVNTLYWSLLLSIHLAYFKIEQDQKDRLMMESSLKTQ